MKKTTGLCAVIVAVAVAGGAWWLTRPLAGITITGASTEPTIEPPSEHIDVELPIRLELGRQMVDGFPEVIKVIDGPRTCDVRYMGKIKRSRGVVILSIKTYEIAAYIDEPTRQPTGELLDELLLDGRPKVYLIRFVNPLPGRAILKDIYTEINTTFTDVDMKRLKSNIDRFCQQFARGSSTGDLISIVWLKQGRVYSCFDAMDKVEFIGQDIPLARAIWRIWAGPQCGPERVDLVSRFATHSATAR